MALQASKYRGGVSPVRCNLMGDLYIYTFTFESNNASAPDGLSPSGGLTAAITGTGDLTFTFDASIKPRVIHFGAVNVLEDDATLTAHYGGYVASTGVVTIHIKAEDGTSGVTAMANSTDKTYQVFLLCNASDLGD